MTYPLWPSLIATVESSDIEVVVEVGVPGISDGVTGSEGGGGISISVGPFDILPNLSEGYVIEYVGAYVCCM